MGKHERAAAEWIERATVALINEEGAIAVDGPGDWLGFPPAYAEVIGDEFPFLERAEHTGNDYSTVGDIRLRLRNEPDHFVELKSSLSPTGVGTNVVGLRTRGAQEWSDA